MRIMAFLGPLFMYATVLSDARCNTVVSQRLKDLEAQRKKKRDTVKTSLEEVIKELHTLLRRDK